MTTLWKDNKCDYTVIIPNPATATEKHAADELVRFIGRGIAVEYDCGDGLDFNRKVISIGLTSIFTQAGIDMSDIRYDGYMIKTLGETVFILAKSQSGILNGAYGFMRKVWGFKVYSHDEFGVSDMGDMYMDEIDIVDNPDFIGRDAHFKETMEGIYPLYASRLSLNGIRSKFTEEEGDGCVWCQSYWAHTQFKLLPKDRYFKSRPEWYSKDGTTLCWTNEEGRRELVKNLKTVILGSPKAVFFSVTQEDGATKCECDGCVESDKKYGGLSGTMMRYVNAVSGDIQEWLKSVDPQRTVYIVTFAYQNTIAPPVILGENGFVPVDESVIARDNVIVRFAPLYNCFSHDIMTAPCNKQFRQSILGWHVVAKHLAVWSYCIGFGGYMVPFNNFGTMQSNYKLYKEFGFLDILDQGSADSQGTSLAWLRIFLHAELMWNVNADFEGLIVEFCEHFYNKAAPYMLEYINLIRNRYTEIERELEELGESFHARPSTRFSTYWERGDFWTLKFVNSAIELIKQASEAALHISNKSLSEKVLYRIKTESLTIRYILINFYGYILPKDKVKTLIEDFEKDAAECKLTHYREGYKMKFKMDEARRYILDGSCFL